MLLELINERPDWMSALAVALALPRGMTERRANQDPWQIDSERPRRISDDLAWLRAAIDEPEEHGLRPLIDTAASAWDAGADDVMFERLARLRNRGVLDAAGFLMHEGEYQV